MLGFDRLPPTPRLMACCPIRKITLRRIDQSMYCWISEMCRRTRRSGNRSMTSSRLESINRDRSGRSRTPIAGRKVIRGTQALQLRRGTPKAN